jgi:hypothetical protein
LQTYNALNFGGTLLRQYEYFLARIGTGQVFRCPAKLIISSNIFESICEWTREINIAVFAHCNERSAWDSDIVFIVASCIFLYFTTYYTTISHILLFLTSISYQFIITSPSLHFSLFLHTRILGCLSLLRFDTVIARGKGQRRVYMQYEQCRL